MPTAACSSWAYDARPPDLQRNRTDSSPTLRDLDLRPQGRHAHPHRRRSDHDDHLRPNGNRLTVSDGTLIITATYDRLDRVATVDDEDAGSTADTTYTYS